MGNLILFASIMRYIFWTVVIGWYIGYFLVNVRKDPYGTLISYGSVGFGSFIIWVFEPYIHSNVLQTLFYMLVYAAAVYASIYFSIRVKRYQKRKQRAAGVEVGHVHVAPDGACCRRDET